MHLRPLVVAVILTVAASTPFVSSASAKPKYLCNNDDECKARFPDTVCIPVDLDGEVIKKCTPNKDDRPACRGAQPGLCPSYQSPEVGLLNAHCVFVAARSKATRHLAAGTNHSSHDGSDSNDDIGNGSIVGEFVCVDISDCVNKAADPSTCEPLACGPPGVKSQCNNHGTCSYAGTQTMDKRTCLCYAGYGGAKCDHEISNECDVDCGLGGDCEGGHCKCKKGYDGGKKATANQRCTKCTSNAVCQNGNKCNLLTGECECGPGFSGPTCGATEDSCTTLNCGKGKCQLLDDGIAACFCPGPCISACTERCPKNDCSACKSDAMSTMPATITSVALALRLGAFMY